MKSILAALVQFLLGALAAYLVIYGVARFLNPQPPPPPPIASPTQDTWLISYIAGKNNEIVGYGNAYVQASRLDYDYLKDTIHFPGVAASNIIIIAVSKMPK